MTIASDLGFEVGKEYRVINGRNYLRVPVGEYVRFEKDNESAAPLFSYKGHRMYCNITTKAGVVRVIPETREQAPSPGKWRLRRTCRLRDGGRLGPGKSVTREAEFKSSKAASGVVVIVRTEDDYIKAVCSSLLEEEVQVPDHSAKIAELQEENLSIRKQLTNMRRRIERKLSFSEQNAREIRRLLNEQQGD